MSTVDQPRCPACQHPVDEQAVLCPTCGTAQIPQMTKTELSRRIGRIADTWFAVKFGLAVLVLYGLALVGLVVLDSYFGLLGKVPWLLSAVNVLMVLILVGGVFVLFFRQRRLLRRAFDRADDPGAPKQDRRVTRP